MIRPLSFYQSTPVNSAQDYVRCQVDSDPIALNLKLKSALDDLGHKHIDIVVNNAGLANPFMPDDKDSASASSEKAMIRVAARLKQFDFYVQNNLRSAFLVKEICKQYLPPPNIGVLASTSLPSASIIHISSTRALASEHGLCYSQEGYASAKSGLIGLAHAHKVNQCQELLV